MLLLVISVSFFAAARACGSDRFRYGERPDVYYDDARMYLQGGQGSCTVGEEWKYCTNRCREQQCQYVLTDTCPSTCGSPGCECRLGYARSRSGRCVPQSECALERRALDSQLSGQRGVYGNGLQYDQYGNRRQYDNGMRYVHNLGWISNEGLNTLGYERDRNGLVQPISVGQLDAIAAQRTEPVYYGNSAYGRDPYSRVGRK